MQDPVPRRGQGARDGARAGDRGGRGGGWRPSLAARRPRGEHRESRPPAPLLPLWRPPSLLALPTSRTCPRVSAARSSAAERPCGPGTSSAPASRAPGLRPAPRVCGGRRPLPQAGALPEAGRSPSSPARSGGMGTAGTGHDVASDPHPQAFSSACRPRPIPSCSGQSPAENRTAVPPALRLQPQGARPGSLPHFRRRDASF